MAIEDLLARLRVSVAENNGCAAWNQWRQGNPDIKIDLSGARLFFTDLSGVDLSGATLSRIDFSGANLSGAHLSNANFSDTDSLVANPYHVTLFSTNLFAINLCGADLRGAHLREVNLTNANLNGADFTEASISATIFANVDLCQVIGLDTVSHLGPSTIGSDTFYNSHGEIPDVFLRGCGLPDEIIGFVHSIAGAIQYYSAFISYNHEDEAFASRLYNDLQANNVRCWKYTEDMQIGDPIHTRVDEAIRLHDKLLVIFSEHALQSGWVAGEVETALAREKRDNCQILFPVTIDAAVKDIHLGWAAEIRRTRNIGNFTGWEHQQQYQPLFDRLLRDLKADER